LQLVAYRPSDYARCEVLPMPVDTASTFALVISGLFSIFMIWVLWMVVKSLKGIDASLSEIAKNGSPKL
jgi:hypothetical protein